MWMSDADDSRDLGDWIVSQEWSNGVIHTMGASADGMGALQTPKTNPSWLGSQVGDPARTRIISHYLFHSIVYIHFLCGRATFPLTFYFAFIFVLS